MRRRQIDLFFGELDRALNLGADVIVAGAAAGSLLGHVRPSLDIDFEIRPKGPKRQAARAKLEAAVKHAQAASGTAVNYSESIGGWSVVSFLDYRKHTRPYKRFGRLNVRILAPEYWTIGKMARFLELDIQDMVRIIRKQKLKPNPLIALWARAVRRSALSLELDQFRDHVIYFLRKYAKRLWGPRTDPERLTASFRRKAAGIR